MDKRLNGPLRGPGLRLRCFCRAGAECSTFLRVCDQFHPNQRQLSRANDADGVTALEQRNHVTKIRGVISDYNRNAMLSRFQNVVAAKRLEAAANESNVREGVNRRKLTNRIQ